MAQVLERCAKDIWQKCKNEKLNIMINFDDVTKEKRLKLNAHWSRVPNHIYKTLIAGGSGSGKATALLTVINHQPYNKLTM